MLLGIAAPVWVLRPGGPEWMYATEVGWQHSAVPRPPAKCVLLPGLPAEALPTRQQCAAAACSSTAALARGFDFPILLPAGLLPEGAQVGPRGAWQRAWV